MVDEPQEAEEEAGGGSEAGGSSERQADGPTPSEAPLVATAVPAGAIGDPGAAHRVGLAARAVNLSREELIDLVVDSGLLNIPPSDGVTRKYTLRDLGYKLWVEMQSGLTTQRAEFYDRLAPGQKTALVVTLRDRGFAPQTIAGTFGLKAADVNRIWNEYADDLGSQVVGVRLSTIVGNLQLVAARAQEGAVQAEDWSLLWKIQKELTQQLQSVGIVDRAIHRVEHEHTHKMDEDQKREIEQLVDLELKKRTRAEELKDVEATIIDSMPEEFTDDIGP